MPVVLICSPAPLDDDLGGTVLAREDVLRHLVHAADEVVRRAVEVKPDLILLDRDMPTADRLVLALRRESGTRKTSIVVIARGEMDPVEVELLEAGANAILRLPVAPEWDERLERLMQVPIRRDVRLPVSLEVEARSGSGVETAAGTALNLSISGMLIDSTYGLSNGDDVDFTFQVPGSDAVIRGTGRVVRHAGRTQFGVEFYGLEGDGREQVAAWVASGASR
jgi:CheY-like chemotaxis protein